jgi:mono/diheme cytochrome c family protein
VQARFAAIVPLVVASLLASGPEVAAQSLEAGRKSFEQRCALCHGAGGEGGERGPAIEVRLSALGDRDLMTLIHEGRPLKGMPGMAVPEPEMAGLLKFLRALQREAPKVVRRSAVRASPTCSF